ncbi:MAG TPA: hypothetical protein VGR89_01675 [Puia sp.]|nr:hypothetical protein [Puia sp.]
MRTSILRTVALIILTVMYSRESFGQGGSSGDRFYNFNVYRADDDSAGMATIVCKGGGSLYVLQIEGNKVLDFSIDGRHIPEDSLGGYQPVIEKIKTGFKEAEAQARRDRQQAEVDRQQAGRDREQADRDRMDAERGREQAERDRQQAIMNRMQADRNREQADLERMEQQRNEMELKLNREQADRNREQADRNRELADVQRQQAAIDREQAERDRLQAARDQEQAMRDREQAERDRQRAEEDRKMMDSLERDLVADGVVPDRESIHSMTINDDGITVNGKRLAAALEKKYMAKYVKKGFSMSYHND